MDFKPNDLARSLNSKRSCMLGVIVPNVAHAFFAVLVRYIELFAYENDYKIILCNSLMNTEKEKEYIELLRRNQVDGIIMASHSLEVEDYINLKLPIITIDREISEDIPFISSDNYTGGIVAAEHLINKKCQKIAHISGNLKLNMLSNKRCTGFIDVCKKYGIDYIVSETNILSISNSNYKSHVETLFAENPDIDGVFASSDVIAATVIKYCIQNNKKVPEDVKIVGYDDIDLTEYTEPSITTIKQPIKEMAQYSVEYLIKSIKGELTPNKTVLPICLIERGSTALK